MNFLSGKEFSVDLNIPLNIPIEKNIKIGKKIYSIFLLSGGEVPETLGGQFLGVPDGNSKIAMVTPVLCFCPS